jgi:putative membrane protein
VTPDFPAINAGLNALAGVLLVVGWTAIRNRHVTLHKTCMVSAFTVSTIFLASYLYYHIVIKGGQPTRFSVEGWPKTIYISILLSHTVLAVAVAIMAPITMWLAFRGSLVRHVAIARWTMPIWLYVSVTGVVVYWMLYQMYPPGS